MDPPQAPNDDAPGAFPESQNYTQETQAATQQSQYPAEAELNLFGRLVPLNPQSGFLKMDFLKVQPAVTVGRSPQNTFHLPGMKISNSHARLIWDGKESRQGTVMVHDTSTNGTYVGRIRLNKGTSRVLRDGMEVCFGTQLPSADPQEDYRFIYQHLAGTPERSGIRAKYDMLEELGRGSFATVMRAMKVVTSEFVAIKVIHSAKLRIKDDSKQVVALGREISILESLNHPNIVKLIEVVGRPDDDIMYLVLEYVDGGDLLDYIVSRNGLGEEEAKHITRQMCGALAHIHARGITHRDLKPENVLVTLQNPPVVKIADFGLAKVVDSLTMLRTMCGTPSYLAPEVVTQTGGSGYDQLVDSWSVGVIVFSMLTNSTPFVEESSPSLDVRQRIEQRSIDWQVLATAGVSAEAGDFIKRLLETNPANRMTMAAALEHPWLTRATTGGQHRGDGDGDGGALAACSRDVSMLSSFPASSEGQMDQDGAGAGAGDADTSVANGLHQLALDGAGASMPGTSSRQLARRSQVLDAQEEEQAKRDADALEDESWAMLASPRGQKRAEPLSPVDEEPGAKRVRGECAAEPVTPARRGGRGRKGVVSPSPLKDVAEEAPRRVTRASARKA